MSVVVFSPMLLCAMQGDPAVPASPAAEIVGTAIVEDRARNDAAGYERAIERLEKALVREYPLKGRVPHSYPPALRCNREDVLEGRLMALMVPGSDDDRPVEFCYGFVATFLEQLSSLFGHEATHDEALRGLIEAKKRRDEAAK